MLSGAGMSGSMSKSGHLPKPRGRKRKSETGRKAPSVEEEPTQAFQNLEREDVPKHLTDLAEQLDREISETVRRKTN
jgi:hypothetical protein